MSTGNLIARATIVIAFWNLSARLLGFGREAVIAYQFGTTEATDAYVVAFTIPSVLFAILTSALVTVVISVFNEYSAKGREDESWRIANSVYSILLVLFTVTTLVGILGAPLLVKLVAPGFKGSASLLATELTRIMLPYVFFSGLATLFTGILNAKNIFGIPAFSGSVTNIVIIVAALTLGSIYGIQGLAIGTVAGMAAAVLVQIPSLWRAGFRFRFHMDTDHPGVRKIFHLILPVMVGVSINQLYIIIDRVLASGLVEGSISALNYANKLMNLPLSLFVLAIGTAIFPTMTRQAALKDTLALKSSIIRSVKLVIMITVPAGIGLFVLRFPIIRLLFERGVFDGTATAMTAFALMFYSIGLVGQASNVIITRGFYALQDTRTPVKLTVVAVTINLIFSLILIRFLAHGGLALANSLAALINMAMLAWFLDKKIGSLWDREMFIFIVKVLLASVVMGVATWVSSGIAAAFWEGSGGLGLLLQVFASITAGVITFVIVSLLLKVDEAVELWKRARILFR